MERRDFIKKATWAGISLPVWISCQTSPSGSTLGQGEGPGTEAFPLHEITIDGLQAKMESGEWTARSITEMYLKRIEEYDKKGPFLNSVIEINPDALTIADTLDQERKSGKTRGLLHGIPVMVKDNIDTGDKMMTTAGSIALEGNKASNDAFIMARLREAGAIILGKTNLSEWANFRADRSSSGWSSRGGQTKNPYILDRNPCGSSSGSGTAVSANLCAVAIGTETNGSIACPSSINGVVGIKPTVGLWSRSGIIPISHTQDTAGPMARTLRDAVIVLGALTGIDTQDQATQTSEGKRLSDYTPFLDKAGLKGKRIGVEKSFMKAHEGVDALLVKALEQMKSQGAEIIEVEFVKDIRSVSSEEFDVLKYEFKDGVNRYLAKANGKVKSLKELIEFNKANESKAMPFFKQDILEASEEKGDLNSKEYKSALEKLLSTVRGVLDKTLKDFQLDALCGPTNGPSWCTDWVNGDFFTGYGTYSGAAIAGYPHITVPMGMVSGLPIGLTFIGQAFGESQLIALAYSYEQASQNRSAPTFIANSSHLG